jgi:hypothetical protein
MSIENETTSDIDFDLVDSKGRKVGCCVVQWSEGGQHYLWHMATRDGATFGAIQGNITTASNRCACSVYSDIHDRDAAALSYVKSARNRAVKAHRR